MEKLQANIIYGFDFEGLAMAIGASVAYAIREEGRGGELLINATTALGAAAISA